MNTEPVPSSTRLGLVDLMTHYSNVERLANAPMGFGFVATNHKGHFLEIMDLGENEIRFIIDNYPYPRKIFSTNIPYMSLEDFENDLDRMGIIGLDRKI